MSKQVLEWMLEDLKYLTSQYNKMHENRSFLSSMERASKELLADRIIRSQEKIIEELLEKLGE